MLIDEKILDMAIEMYCRAREELLFYQNRVPTESSILSRQYVKAKLLAMENVHNPIIIEDYWVFDAWGECVETILGDEDE